MKEQCKKDVPTPGMNFYRPKKCARAAVKDGYCTQHHPDSVAARDEKARNMQEARLKRSPYYMVSELKAALEAAEVTNAAMSLELDRLRARVAELEQIATRLKTVMSAAAVEIEEHWDAHCDNDGYGPVNLLHRLRFGIAEYYPAHGDDPAAPKEEGE